MLLRSNTAPPTPRTHPCPGFRTPRKAGRIQAGRRATLTDATCKRLATGACTQVTERGHTHGGGHLS
jgi:arylamine N-acetyltransferase